MKLSVLVSAAVLSLALISSDAFGMNMWSDRGRDGHGWARWAGKHYNGKVSVPEPSSMYALGSAVALLGGAAWILRRK